MVEQTMSSLRMAVELMEGAGSFEQMTRAMTDHTVISPIQSFLAKVVGESSSKKLSRILLSAFLIDRHPETLSSASHQIQSKASTLLHSLHRLLLQNQETDEMFMTELLSFEESFRAWQREDRMVLQEGLAKEVESAAALLSTVREDAKWEPHVKAHLAHLLSLQTRLEGISVQQAREITNVQIAHDLFLEGDSFDYHRSYDPHHHQNLQAKLDILAECGIEDPSVVMEVLRSIRRSLEGMVEGNADARERIGDGIDLELVEAQLKAGSFDPTDILTFILDTMSTLCAPCRDHLLPPIHHQIRSSTQKQALASILTTLDTMSSDLIRFNLAKAMPHLPSIIRQYERDAFAEKYGKAELGGARRVARRVYKRPDMTERELAAEMLILALSAPNLKYEMICLDGSNLDRLRDALSQISLSEASRLSGLPSVKPTDPTCSLLTRRLHSALLSTILTTDMTAEETILLSSLSQAGKDSYLAVKVRLQKIFDHHFNVFQPIYHQLLPQ